MTGPGENPKSAEPWCADFVSWVFKQAGAPVGAGGKGEDYTVAMKQWAQGEGRWRAKDHVPKPGDIVFYDWQNDGKVDHVALVEKVNGRSITTIGGNEDGAVRRQERPLNTNIAGFVVAE